jgi:hypothetical protein
VRWWIGLSEGDAKYGGEAAPLLSTRSELAFHLVQATRGARLLDHQRPGFNIPIQNPSSTFNICSMLGFGRFLKSSIWGFASHSGKRVESSKFAS